MHVWCMHVHVGGLCYLFCRVYLEEKFVWRVFHQLLQALQECYRQRNGVHKVC